MSAAQAWFVAGTVPLVLAGALHVVYTLIDTRRPTYFTPIDRGLREPLDRTGIRLVGKDQPSMWRVWLGINVSHGLGVFAFGLLCLLIALQDPDLVERIDALLPMAVAFAATYLVLSLRFWFYAPAIITGSATVCFAVAAILAA